MSKNEGCRFNLPCIPMLTQMFISLIPEHAIVTTTGVFRTIPIRDWISARGARYVVWSPRITHILVGSEPNTWKLANAPPSVKIVSEAEILATISGDLWVDKYRPKQLKDVIGHGTAIADLQSWLRKFTPTGDAPRAALLTGPPGIGKTTIAHAVAREAGYEIAEFNASDERSARAIKELGEKLSRFGTIGTKRLVIMDEVDGMSGGDRGGMGEIARLCRTASFPIICIANDRSSPKIRPLASACLDIRVSRPTKTAIAKSLVGGVLKQEGVTVSAAEVEELCERNGNDIRAILNSLQFGSRSSAEEKSGDDKDAIHRLDPFSATGKIFGSGKSGSLDDRTNYFFVDHSLVPLMVAEGYVAAAKKSRSATASALERCAAAADRLTDWDLLDTRVRKQQAWHLLPAAAAACVSAAAIADGPAPFQIFPAWLGKNSKRQKHRRLLGELRQHLGPGSESDVLDTRNLLRTKLFDTSLGPQQVVQELKSLGLNRDDMMETLVETVYKGEDSVVAMDTKKKSAVTREWKKSAPSALTAAKIAPTEAEEETGDLVNGEESEEDVDY
jgi:replication factor C subunit 1